MEEIKETVKRILAMKALADIIEVRLQEYERIQDQINELQDRAGLLLDQTDTAIRTYEELFRGDKE